MAASRPRGSGVADLALRVIDSPLWGALCRLPGLQRALTKGVHRALDGREWVSVTLRAGPLSGLRLEFNPKVHGAVITATYETVVESFISQHLRRGDIAFDIGANVGYFGLVMAARVGPMGHVFCFEPFPPVLERLQSNICRNERRVHGAVTTVPMALGSEQGRLAFEQGITLTRGRLSANGTIEVEVGTVDHEVARRGVPALVKVDVEGGELEVLQGGADLLGRRATAFIVEAHTPELAERCTALLQGNGYTCRWSSEPGRRETYVMATP